MPYILKSWLPKDNIVMRNKQQSSLNKDVLFIIKTEFC